LKYHQVVTSFLTAAQQILLLRRGGKVGSHRGKWSAVSGYLEGTEQPLTRAVTEIREEVGLSAEQINLVRIGEILRAYDEENDTVWIIHPFLFEAMSKSIKLDWENIDYRWVAPAELTSYDTVPKLRETLDRVRYDLQSEPPSLTDVIHKVRQLGEDRIHGATFLGQEAVKLLSEAAQASDARDTDAWFSHLLLVALRLRRTQPAMANVWNLAGRLVEIVDKHRAGGAPLQDLRNLIPKMSTQLLEDGAKTSEDVSRNTAQILPQDGVVLTHSYSSTVLRALELGFKGGRGFKVYATESYPGMEGKQLAKELIASGVPVTLIADPAVASIFQEVDLVLVGADSVLKDGSLIHKVGTRDIATVTKNHGIPLYSSCEVIKFSTQDFLGERPETPSLFDVTPAELVSSYITEEGELAPANVEQQLRGLQKEIYP
jgi:translation initiation factor 2B subunit (eIF-2B alpha/beta/delta family)/8-oxo-dGTP pyrophosphatase MutT (NUDIX family)